MFNRIGPSHARLPRSAGSRGRSPSFGHSVTRQVRLMTEIIAVIVGALLATALNTYAESKSWRRAEAQTARLVFPEALRVIWHPTPYSDMQRYLGEMRVRLSAVGIPAERIDVLETAVVACWKNVRESAEHAPSDDEIGVSLSLHEWLQGVVAALDRDAADVARPGLLRFRRSRTALPETPCEE